MARQGHRRAARSVLEAAVTRCYSLPLPLILIGAVDQATAVFDAVEAIVDLIELREFGANMRQHGSPRCDGSAV